MYQTFSPLLDALKERGADPQAVDRAAAEAEATGRSIRAVLINDHIVTEDHALRVVTDTGTRVTVRNGQVIIGSIHNRR